MTVTRSNYGSIVATLNYNTLPDALKAGYDTVKDFNPSYTDWTLFDDPEVADFLNLYFQKLGTYLSTPTTPTTPAPTTPSTPTTPPSGGGFSVSASYNTSNGVITVNTSGASGTVEYEISGLRSWGTGNTFQVPTHQQNGTSFTVNARTSTSQSGTTAVTATALTGTPSTPTTPTTTPPPTTPPPTGGAGLTGETKNGLRDGQHIANHGNAYPIFARVVNGVLYAVAVEPTPGNAYYNQVVTVSRAWLTSSQGAAYAAWFADKPHQQIENISAGLFVRTLASGSTAVQPTGTAPSTPTTTPPTTTPPSTTTPPVSNIGPGGGAVVGIITPGGNTISPLTPVSPGTTTPGTTTPGTTTPQGLTLTINQPATPTTTTTSSKKWLPYVLGSVGVVVLVIVGVLLYKGRSN